MTLFQCKRILLLMLVGWLSLNTSFAVTLVFTSNMANVFQQKDKAGLSQLAGYIESLRAQPDAEVVFVHGGDSLFPNALSVYDNGAHMVDILNSMQTDIFAINQRELAKGLDPLTLRTSEARFPMVLSNVQDLRSMQPIDGTLPYYLLPTSKMTLGFMMMMAPSINQNYLLGEVIVADALERVELLSQQMKAEGADKIILITEGDVLKIHPIEAFQAVDLLLVAAEVKDSLAFAQRPLVARSGGNDGEVVVIQLAEETQTSTAEVVRYATAPASKIIDKVINTYTSRLSAVLDYKLGRITAPMNSLRTDVRTAEIALGNVIADALRESLGADMAVVNSGSIRGYRHYAAGTVLTRKDIQNELPFGSTPMVVEITPAELTAMMEQSLSGVEDVAGRYLQISGFTVVYDLHQPVGRRVISISRYGEPLTEAVYDLVITDYLKKGGDGYTMFPAKDIKSVPDHVPYVSSLVSDYIERKSTIKPQVEGRLTNVADQGN